MYAGNFLYTTIYQKLYKIILCDVLDLLLEKYNPSYRLITNGKINYFNNNTNKQ